MLSLCNNNNNKPIIFLPKFECEILFAPSHTVIQEVLAVWFRWRWPFSKCGARSTGLPVAAHFPFPLVAYYLLIHKRVLNFFFEMIRRANLSPGHNTFWLDEDVIAIFWAIDVPWKIESNRSERPKVPAPALARSLEMNSRLNRFAE